MAKNAHCVCVCVCVLRINGDSGKFVTAPTMGRRGEQFCQVRLSHSLLQSSREGPDTNNRGCGGEEKGARSMLAISESLIKMSWSTSLF